MFYWISEVITSALKKTADRLSKIFAKNRIMNGTKYISIDTIPGALLVLFFLGAVFYPVVFVAVFLLKSWDVAVSVTPVISAFAAVAMLFSKLKEAEDRKDQQAKYGAFENELKASISEAFSLGEEGARFVTDKYTLIVDAEASKAVYYENSFFEHASKYGGDIISYCTLINSENLLEVSLKTNEGVVSKVGVAGALTGAAIGGIIAGGTTALIGAIAGKNSNANSVAHSIDIIVVVESPNVQMIAMNFLNSKDGIKKSSPKFKDAAEEAYKWWALLTVIKGK